MPNRTAPQRDLSIAHVGLPRTESNSCPCVARRRLAGNVSLMAIAMVALFSTVLSFTVSTGEVLVKRQQLQDLADAVALAGAAALRDGEDSLQAAANAADILSQPDGVPFTGLSLPEGAIEVGRYDFIQKAFRSSVTGNEGIPAVRVSLPLSAGLEDDTANGSVLIMSSFLRDQLGIQKLSMRAEAIAVVRPRDIVIVQDITGSFIDEFEFARQADLSLVDIIATSYGGLGDQIGVVTFGRSAYTEFPLTSVAEGVEDLKVFLESTMEVCTTSSSRHRFANRRDHRRYDPTDPTDTTGRRLRRINCQGTGTGPALKHATTMLENAVARGSEPVIVLLTDGVPCHYSPRQSQSQWVANGKKNAIAAAIVAKERGIRVFVVDLSFPPFGPDGSCSANGSDFNLDLASHGFGTTTADPADLERKLLEIANKLTLRLVH